MWLRLMVMMLGMLQLDAFFKHPVYPVNTRNRVLFSWEFEAIKGIVVFGTLAVYLCRRK